MGVSGTIRKVTIDGISYVTHGDVDITEVIGKYTNEGLPTTGQTIRKMTARIETREGFSIACDPDEAEVLKAVSENTKNIPLGYVLADGSKWTATGFIEFENRTTAENRATVKLIPSGTWDLFAAA